MARAGSNVTSSRGFEEFGPFTTPERRVKLGGSNIRPSRRDARQPANGTFSKTIKNSMSQVFSFSTKRGGNVRASISNDNTPVGFG